MDAREELQSLERERAELIARESRLHDIFMCSPSGSDAEKAADAELASIMEQLDANVARRNALGAGNA